MNASRDSHMINKDDVNIIINRALKSKVEIVNYCVKANSDDKIGLLSTSYTLKVDVKHTKNSDIENYKFFIKTSDKAMVSDEPSVKEEIYFYTNIYPNMMKVYSGIPWAPKFHLSKDNMIVLEDLQFANYSLLEDKDFTSIENLKSIVSALARFHASSILLEKYHDKPLNQVYPTAFTEKHFCLDYSFGRSTYTTLDLITALSNYFGLGSYDKNKILERLFEGIKPDNKFNAICHGDIWKNNLMFNGNKCVLVDFQLLRYTSPLIDISMLFYVNFTPEYRKTNEHAMLKVYHNTLCDVLKNHNLKPKVPLFEDILEAYEKYRIHGLTYAAMYRPTSILSIEERMELLKDAAMIEKFIYEDRVSAILPKVKENPLYENLMKEIVQEFIEYVKKLK